MVHKKYTYKDGKKYGPYYYETKRIDGKIVTKYLGTDYDAERKRTWKFVSPVLFALLLVIAVVSIIYLNPNLTGNVVDDSSANSDSASSESSDGGSSGGVDAGDSSEERGSDSSANSDNGESSGSSNGDGPDNIASDSEESDEIPFSEDIPDINSDKISNSDKTAINSPGAVNEPSLAGSSGSGGGSSPLAPSASGSGNSSNAITGADPGLNINRVNSANQNVNLVNGSDLQIETIQGEAVLNRPVKWTKKLDISGPVEVRIEVPASAFNISINRIPKSDESDNNTLTTSEDDSITRGDEIPASETDDSELKPDVSAEESSGTEEQDEKQGEAEGSSSDEARGPEIAEPETPSVSFDITGSVIAENPSGNVDFSWFFELLRSFARITGFVAYEGQQALTKEIIITLDENEKGIVLEYETPAPYLLEENSDRGKIVSIIAPEDVAYENVSVFSELKDLSVRNTEKVEIYWAEEEIYLDKEEVRFEDSDSSGIYDRVDWVIPKLSGKQTFLIIVITRAEHLDENRTFISDIFDSVKELDGNWSEEILDGHYVRVTFEKNLTSKNDITIYPRIVSGDPEINVYEIDGNESIAKFDSLNENEYNKVFLSGLSGEQESFDLHILNGSVEFDHIIDPNVNISVGSGTGTNVTIETNFSHLNVSDSNLFLYVPFDDNVSNVDIYDYSNNGFDGSYLGDAHPVEGLFGVGAYTDGVNDVADDSLFFTGAIRDSGVYNSSFSVAVWIKPGADVGSHLMDIAGTETNAHTGTQGWVLRITSGSPTIRFSVSNGTDGGNFDQASTTASAGVWQHLVGVYNHTTPSLELYYNGGTNGATTAAVPPGGADDGAATRFGATNGANRIYNGTIDEAMIFNKALNSSEVSDLFNNQSARFYSRGEHVFSEINVSGAGDENRVNVTITELLNFDNENFTIQVGDSGAGAYTYGTETQISAGKANDLEISTPNNISVRVVFYPDTNRFYTPILKGNISLDSWTAPDDTNVNVCKDLTLANTVYNVTANLESNGTCLTVLANNITIQGNGFLINYSINGSRGHGVFVELYNYTTINNLVIKEGNFSGDDFKHAIFLNKSFYAVVANSTLESSSSHSHVLNIEDDNNQANGHIIEYNTINNTNIVAGASGVNAIKIISSDNNIIRHNTLGTVTARCLTLQFGNDVVFNNNTCYGIPGNGINFNGALNITVANSTFYNTGFIFLTQKFRSTTASFVNNTIALRNSSVDDLNVAPQSSSTNFTFIDQYFENYSFGVGIESLEVKITGAGEIKFLNSVDGSGTNLSNDIIIRNNLAEVKVSNNVGLNSSANVTFYNMPGNFLHPAIYRDGVACPSSICYNFTSLNAGTVVFNVTGWSNYTIEETNDIPSISNIAINSTDGSNRTLQDLHCSASLIDGDSDNMNVTVWWFNNSIEHLRLDYNNSYASGTFFVATLESQNTTKNQNWSCGLRAFDPIAGSLQVNSSNLTILNTPPATPSLISPSKGSSTTDRTPLFMWGTVTDIDGDPVSYELNITCYHLAGGGCSGKGNDNRHVSIDAGFTSHELTGDLQYFYDSQYYYNWTARSYDGEEYSSWNSNEFNFNLSSSISITLLNDSVNFGVIAQHGTNDTTDNSPLPFLLENSGNAFVNVSLQATSLWNSVSGSSRFFQFKADNYTLENGSFNWGLSTTLFTNVSIGSNSLVLAMLNYTNATDSAEIDLNITVPENEGSDVRSSTITFTASLTE